MKRLSNIIVNYLFLITSPVWVLPVLLLFYIFVEDGRKVAIGETPVI